MKKQLFSILFTLLLCFSLATPSLAANTHAVSDTISVTNESIQLPKSDIPQTRGWGGTAPQITKIEMYDYGWLESGNFGIILKVTGYGNCRTATFNGNTVTDQNIGHFINYGNTADGFYYLFDCGKITEPGTYNFNCLFRSTNAPQTERSYSTSFTFS